MNIGTHTGPSRRDQAFLAFCRSYDYADDDRDAPHAEAFLAGYDAGMADGFDDALTDAARRSRSLIAELDNRGGKTLCR